MLSLLFTISVAVAVSLLALQIYLYGVKPFRQSCYSMMPCTEINNFDGLVQEKRYSSALAMGLRLSYTNPSI